SRPSLDRPERHPDNPTPPLKPRRRITTLKVDLLNEHILGHTRIQILPLHHRPLSLHRLQGRQTCNRRTMTASALPMLILLEIETVQGQEDEPLPRGARQRLNLPPVNNGAVIPGRCGLPKKRKPER